MKTTTMMIALLLASSSAYAASAQKIMDNGCKAIKNDSDREDCQKREAQYLSANKSSCDPAQATIYKTTMIQSVCGPASDISYSQCVQGSGAIKFDHQYITAQDDSSYGGDVHSVTEEFSGPKNDIAKVAEAEHSALDQLSDMEVVDAPVGPLTSAPQYDAQCHLINNSQASNKSFGQKVQDVVVQIYNLADPEKAALLGSGSTW